MQHKGIDYMVRARPGRDEWTWTIYPPECFPRSGETRGRRDRAVEIAIQAIEVWLQRTRLQAKSTDALAS
jgi:hypothetical protein